MCKNLSISLHIRFLILSLCIVFLCSCDLFDLTPNESIEVKFEILPNTSEVVIEDFQFSVTDITLGFNNFYDFPIEHNDSVFIFDLQMDSALFIENALIEARSYKNMRLNFSETAELPIEPMDQHNSMLVSGSYLGNNFTLIFDHDSSLSINFKKPLDFRSKLDTLTSLSIVIDTDSWFSSKPNQILDPTDISNHPKIKDNILNSFSIGEVSVCKNPKSCEDPDIVLPEIISADTSTSENSETIDFRLDLSFTTSDTIIVYYETLSRAAKSGEDFVFVSDSVVFKPLQKQHFISIPIINDSKKESDESFVLKLLSSKNAIISKSNKTVTGKILNDDN